MKAYVVLMLAAAVGFVAGGCGQSTSSGTYSREQAMVVQTVHEGEVIMVREVEIEGTRSGAGAIAGGAMGYTLGSTIGAGKGRRIAKTTGAITGAAAGAAMERSGTRMTGLEITVELEDGRVVSIVQAADEEFEEGDLVRVLMRMDGSARVSQ